MSPPTAIPAWLPTPSIITGYGLIHLQFRLFPNEVNATTYALVAPTNLTALAASMGQINLRWTDGVSNETGFKIERKTGAAALGANCHRRREYHLLLQHRPDCEYPVLLRVRAYNATGNFELY